MSLLNHTNVKDCFQSLTLCHLEIMKEHSLIWAKMKLSSFMFKFHYPRRWFSSAAPMNPLKGNALTVTDSLFHTGAVTALKKNKNKKPSNGTICISIEQLMQSQSCQRYAAMFVPG